MDADKSIFSLGFNSRRSFILHLDINSCFATIEQQANPNLRGRPVAVTAYNGPGGCIIAASVEAKSYGIKVGMRVKEGQQICPYLNLIQADPPKYRFIHFRLKELLCFYSDKVRAESIDEFTLDFSSRKKLDLFTIAQKIKKQIKENIGEWLTVSIGIAPNRFLAKTAANLRKPDGISQINKNNFLQIYAGLSLTDLCGIAGQNLKRLYQHEIYSTVDFYNAPITKLKSAFKSITAYFWYLRLRGWEIDLIDFKRRSFGNSYALPVFYEQKKDLMPIVCKLVEKTGSRLRKAGYKAEGVYIRLYFADRSFWGQSKKIPEPVYAFGDIYKFIKKIWQMAPSKPVRKIAVGVFRLSEDNFSQLSLFEKNSTKNKLADIVDTINRKFGTFTAGPASIFLAGSAVPDRIPFGAVGD